MDKEEKPCQPNQNSNNPRPNIYLQPLWIELPVPATSKLADDVGKHFLRSSFMKSRRLKELFREIT